MSIIASQYLTGKKIIYLTSTIIYKEVKLEGPYNLCSSVPNERLTAEMASTYLLSLLVAELTASPGTTGIALCKVANSENVASLASVYDLSTEGP